MKAGKILEKTWESPEYQKSFVQRPTSPHYKREGKATAETRIEPG
jgi:hypothetical protein